jgi:hypothetical protein
MAKIIEVRGREKERYVWREKISPEFERILIVSLGRFNGIVSYHLP